LLTEQAGYEVDPDVIEKGFTWLVGALASETDERIRAYGAYVMAIGGRGDTAMTLAVYQARDRLDAFSLAALAVALSKVGRDDLAQSALDALIASAAETPTTVSWPVDVVDWRRWDDYHWRTMASTEKNTAMALEALAVLRPDSPLAPKAARWLMENRWGWSGGWSTTQATTFSILALTDYIVSSGELWAEYDWSVALDGNSIAAGRIDASNVKERLAPVVLTGDDLTPGAHQLTIAKVGRGTLYYTVVGRMALYYDGFEPTAAEGFGMTLSREYSPVAGRGDLGGWHAGDVVNVRLTVETTEDLHYMIIEDMLPAGFEALNEQLATESTRVPTKPEYRWYWWGYERKEVHDQKVTFFASYLSRGVHTFDYAARVVTPGLFSARPAESYAMYRPEVWARSASAQVSIDADRIAQRPPLSGDFDRDCRLTSFDASLVAEAWPADSRRDVNGDGRLDVADIALAGGHSGLVCGNAVPLPPGDAGEMALRLVAPEGISVGQTFDLELRASGNGNVGGFEATLAWPAGAFEVVGVHVDDLVAGAMALEQDESAGIRFGGFAPSGIELSGEKVLARVTLRAASEGEATIAVVRAQMVTDEGGEYRVVSDGTVVSPAPWRPMATLYMPSVAKLGNMQ
jgi:hypothetical protein